MSCLPESNVNEVVLRKCTINPFFCSGAVIDVGVRDSGTAVALQLNLGGVGAKETVGREPDERFEPISDHLHDPVLGIMKHGLVLVSHDSVVEPASHEPFLELEEVVEGQAEDDLQQAFSNGFALNVH